jgi:putative spermidine/putrescine transport system ATP-binding protein
MVFQNYALFPHMTVAENIAFPLKLRRIGSKESRQRVDEALSTVQLSDLGGRRIDQLSGGQMQRVALARAFVFRPRILLMDEPLSALDKKLREQMQIELKQLHRKLGVTTVYVTHDQREALTMSDRIAVINHGRFEQIETPQAIYNAPANPFVADFIGESAMLPMKRNSSGDLFYQDLLIASDYSELSDEEWLLVIRPERLFAVQDSTPASDQTIIFTGVITEFVYQGETAFALVSISDQHNLSIRFGTDSSGSQNLMRTGDTLRLGLKRSETIIIPKPST